MIVVSACLVGLNCRYNGKGVVVEEIVELVKQGKAVPVCPEQLGGLSTPRPPSEIIEDNGNVKVVNNKGEDVTHQFQRGANETLELAKRIGAKCAILKQRSPSCGNKCVYDGTFSSKIVDGEGMTARLLRENNIVIYDEDDFKCLLKECE